MGEEQTVGILISAMASGLGTHDVERLEAADRETEEPVLLLLPSAVVELPALPVSV